MLGTLFEALVTALILLVLAATAWRFWRQGTAAEKQAIRTPNGIAEAGFVTIGGIPQWVSIRGEDLANPVLIIAHGGPGSGFLALAYEALRPWEAQFTVVQWDQRGAGLTFSHGGPKGQGEMSLQRIADDGLEVAAHAAARTGQAKSILMGVSWGSMVAVAMARKRPELFHAFVGSGQVVDMPANEALGYDGLMQRVRAAGDAKSERELIKIGAPPFASLRQLAAERQIMMMRHPPASERGMMTKLIVALLSCPGVSLKQAYDYLPGAASFSLKALEPVITSYSDRQPSAPFALPVVFIQGAEDIQTPTSLVEEYYANITAPSKQLVLLPGGGHMAFVAQSPAFLAALVENVRPLAVTPHPVVG